MNKEAFWFRHDSNAKDDPKCVLLIDQLGLEGYGIYWVLVELLREQPEYMYPLAMVPSVARRYGTTAEKMMTVIKSFGLFEIQDDMFFFSRSLMERMTEYNAVRQRRIDAGRLGGKAKAMLKQCSGNAKAMLKQSQSNALANPGYNSIKENNINIDNSSSLHSELSPTLPEPEPQSDPSDIKTLSRKNCQQVADFWNRTIEEKGSTLPKVQSLSDARCDKIRIRWGEFSKVGDPVEVCRELFGKAAGSKFLQGDNANGWKASFDWLMTNGKNWVKVLEGNYDDREAGQRSKGERMWDNVRRNLESLPFNEDGTVNI